MCAHAHFQLSRRDEITLPAGGGLFPAYGRRRPPMKTLIILSAGTYGATQIALHFVSVTTGL